MLLRGIDSVLSHRSQEIGRRWLVQTRKAPNLTGLAIISDAEMMEFCTHLLAILGGWFRGEAGKPEIGAFFVGSGKDFCKKDVPISLLTRAFVHLRKLVTECLLEEENLEGTHRIYALMEAVDHHSDFFMLGIYYFTKGYLEETFIRISAGENLSKEVMGKYLKDDFFFK
ncbi:MAG: hypothetical protein WCQ50_20965 [Spirochaetota bacterium]